MHHSNKMQCNTAKFKRDLCNQFSRHGKCNYGNVCQFAHGKHDIISYASQEVATIPCFVVNPVDGSHTHAGSNSSCASGSGPACRLRLGADDDRYEWVHLDRMIERLLS